MTAWEDAINAESPAPFVWLKTDGTAGTSPTSLTNNGSKTGWTTNFTRAGNTTNVTYTSGGKSNTALTWASATNQTTYDAYISNEYYLALDTGTYSIEFWAKVPYLYGGRQPHVINIYGSGDNTLSFAFPGAGQPSAGKIVVGNRANYVMGLISTANVSDDIWHHYVYTYDGPNLIHKLYIDGVLHISGAAQASQSLKSNNIRLGASRTSSSSENFQGSIDEFVIWDQVLTATDVADHYNSTNSVSVNYTNTTGATASSTFPMPTHTAETVINIVYNSGTFIADTGVLVDPSLSVSSNLDAFGVVGTASTDIVNPTIFVEKNTDYSHTVSTATALMTSATITTTISNNYSASPATCSALFAANLHFGPVIQDTSYNLNIRTIAKVFSTGVTTNYSGSLTFPIGYQTSGATLDSINSVAIKPLSGIPTSGSIVKVRISDTTSILTPNAPSTGFEFNVYAYTANPSSGLTFDTMTYDTMPAKELLFTTRRNDEGGNYRIDLTSAFHNSNANNYGIYIEAVPVYEGSGTNYRRVEYSHSSGGSLTTSLFYILTSEFTNANMNADVFNASALFTDAAVSLQTFININADSQNASADIANPTIVVEQSSEYLSSVFSASAELANSTFRADATQSPVHLDAHSEFPAPSLDITGTVFYNVEPATLSALLHMPQAEIGENNSVDHMNADALMVQPLIVIPDTNAADLMTATAIMPNAVGAGQLLGAVTAEPMRATNARLIDPPAFKNLFDDPWYATMFAQLSVRRGTGQGNIFSGDKFMKLFEDVYENITQATPNTVQPNDVFNGEPTRRQLRGNITWGMHNNTGPENDIRKVVATVNTDVSTTDNPAIVEIGYTDPYNRKAVRFRNASAKILSDYEYLRKDFSLEFSIKTTKANQVLGSGLFSSQISTGRSKATYNLLDGKFNIMYYAGYYDDFHPKNVPANALLTPERAFNLTGNKRLDDGEWHYVQIQFQQGADVETPENVGRLQIWIDGELDIQKFGMTVNHFDTIGSNQQFNTYASDFQTSVLSMESNVIIDERQIDLHYYDFIKYKPVFAEAMTATVTAPQNAKGKGNRARALMLYWWPSGQGQNSNLITQRFNTPYQNTGYSEFDLETFDNSLSTWDFSNQPPQQYYGWDVFPVDVTGYFVSDLVKKEAYGGEQNIGEHDFGTNKYKTNSRGFFRNTLDDTRRYLDIVNDIDLSQFDAIFFKNYPDQTNEIEFFARNEPVDKYFNIREVKIFEDFIKSLRNAMNTGISLMVTNPQLALDLKIIDRIDVVPDLQDTGYYYSDPYSPTIVPTNAQSLPVGPAGSSRAWYDWNKNNKHRIVNTVSGLTDIPGILWKDAAFWNNDDTFDFGGASRDFWKYEYKNALQVGDEFIISDTNGRNSKNYQAVPISAIKAGIPVTTFAPTYRRGLELVNNPYADYATTIVVRPGDILDGTQVVGKIFVSFTENLSKSSDWGFAELTTDYWVDFAKNQGAITEATANNLKADLEMNLNRKLEQGLITQAQFERDSYWSVNGMNIISQIAKYETSFIIDQQVAQSGAAQNSLTKSNTSDAATAGLQYTGKQIWFSFKYSRKFPTIELKVPSIITRGFWWISNRVQEVGEITRPTAMTGSVEMLPATPVVQKINNTFVSAMIANATIVDGTSYTPKDKNIVSLPMTATASMILPEKRIFVVAMTANIETRQNIIIRTTASDQVVMYVLHEDPILYLREDVIK